MGSDPARAPFIAFLAFASAASSGCGAYGVDRWRDLCDIPTAAAEYVSFGATARAGPLATGFGLAGGQGAGLLGGRVGAYKFEAGAFLSVHGHRIEDLGGSRGKEHRTAGFFPFPVLFRERAAGLLDTRLEPEGFIPLYAQFELAAGIAGGVRLGVNPGEFLDFLAGWFGADLFGDDVASRDGPKETSILGNQ